METVRWEELISEKNWDVDARSDTELEHSRDKLCKDAARRKNADPEKESRLITHPDVGLPVPRTETSFSFKLAKKKPRTKRSKKSLDGLYEVVAPGSSVVKTDAYTSAIKEPGKREVTIRNSDLAKLGTKAQRQTELQIYANRMPIVPSGKIKQYLINQHAREARMKLKGNKRMKHRKVADDAIAVSSIHSNVTRALRVTMPTKHKRTVVPAPLRKSKWFRATNAAPIDINCNCEATIEAKKESRYQSNCSNTAITAIIKKAKNFSVNYEIRRIISICPNMPSNNFLVYSTFTKQKKAAN